MRSLISCLVIILSATLLVAAQGTVPRGEVTAYPNHVEVEGVSLGVSVLKDAEVKQRFVTELGRDYLVVEVALYPKDGVDLKVEPDRFVLRTLDQERAMRSENPKVVVAALRKAEESKKEIILVPHVGVGYESGTGRYDPATGTYRRTSGIYTSTGIDVMVGNPYPDPNPRNEEVMVLELSEKGLPAGTFQKPVAGHLYFRIGKELSKDKATRFELSYELNGKEGALELKR
ncbi:MAG: hypothetical protein LAP85_28725 [Acidobacteriia bacterium]|nr:hypothetical protein [Terriglobia bacterium]